MQYNEKDIIDLFEEFTDDMEDMQDEIDSLYDEIAKAKDEGKSTKEMMERYIMLNKKRDSERSRAMYKSQDISRKYE